MKNIFLNFVTWTSKFNWPMSHKKFNIKDLKRIEKYLEENNVEFAVFLVTTAGAMSNAWIKLSYLFGKVGYHSSPFTHAVGYVNDGICKHTVVEALGSGIETNNFCVSISQRDYVKLLIPSVKVPHNISKKMKSKILEISELDKKKGIAYDFEHDALDHSKFDCSELIFNCINDAYIKSGHPAPLKTVKRFGKQTYAPIDVEHCDLLTAVYDSRKGFL